MAHPYDRPANGNPGGCECMKCGVIFIGAEHHEFCAVCIETVAKEIAEAQGLSQRPTMEERTAAQKCHWCEKEGSWPAICKSTRDMEEKPHDPVCDATLLRLGGGERIVNQARARRAHPNGMRASPNNGD